METSKKQGLTNGSMGVIGFEPYPPYYFDGPMLNNTWKRILENLPGATFKPVQGRFFQLIAPRSPEGLEVLKWSAQVGEKMSETIRPGVLEGDIYAAVTGVCLENVGFKFQPG